MAKAAANPDGSVLEDFNNESRNDFDYRPDCVLAGWRRLVLGAWSRLTRPVLEIAAPPLLPTDSQLSLILFAGWECYWRGEWWSGL